MTSTPADKAPWEAQGNEKREAVRRLFAEIAPSYDFLNSLMSLSLHHRWRKAAVRKLALESGETALDLCCGTGDFMRPLRKAVGQDGLVFGLDFCEPMLQIAAGKNLGRLAIADACALPISDAKVNSVTVGWGIRNVSDIDQVHREVVRVLKPGGRFASLDMAKPRHRVIRWIAAKLLTRGLPLLGSLFRRKPAYSYLPQSTERFWSREELRASMERAGLVRVGWKDYLLGNICLHWGEKP
jgi:demethylmenaquinone methyltransferase / 2-methoxy-6-polyprenyl-1,4-benzoquinol methylase